MTAEVRSEIFLMSASEAKAVIILIVRNVRF